MIGISKLLMTGVAAFSLAAMAADLPEKTTDQGIRYVTGGVGQTEADAMRAAARGYSLELVMATANGAYLSDVQVTVKRPDGTEVLSTTSQGPILLADLPPGSYSVEAVANGKSVSERVNVTRGQHQRTVLRWPSSN